MGRIFSIILIFFSMILSLNASDLYKPCAGCHGDKGERSALERSKIINQMTKEDFISAMKGYKDGTYGSSMKGLMKVQVKRLSDDEIVKIAEFITNK